MFLEINEDQKLKIITNDLKNSIDYYTNEIAEMDLKKEGHGNYSWDYKEDRKSCNKMLKALLKVYNYYGGNI